MNPVLSLLPSAVVLSVYAAYIRLSARLRHARVSWKHSFIFALLVMVSAIVGRLASPPFLISIICSLSVQIVAGGWFFSTRARNPDGAPLGWRRAIEMQMLAFVLFMATALALFGIVRGILSLVQR